MKEPSFKKQKQKRGAGFAIAGSTKKKGEGCTLYSRELFPWVFGHARFTCQRRHVYVVIWGLKDFIYKIGFVSSYAVQ